MRIARLIATLSLLAAAAPAEDAANLAAQVKELRKTVEEQGKQIEALTQKLSKLAPAADAKPSAEAAPAAPPESAPAAAKEEFSIANGPKGEPGQPRHVVVKGETLTSIAKHYNMPLSELMKANKGLDERKLQIGQSILLPATPAPKPSDTKPTQ